MSGKVSLSRRIVSFVFSEAALQAFWTYVFPPLFGLATFVAGIVEHQPIMWVMAAGALAFAMVSFGLLSFNAWRTSRSPEHKITFSRCLINRRTVGKAKKIEVGFAMRSSAEYPLEVILTKLETTVAARIPQPKIPLPRKLRVDARNDFYFIDHPIDITGVTDEGMPGTLAIEVQYGRVGGRRYTFSWEQILFIPLDQKKPFSASAKVLDNEQASQGG